MDFKTVEEIYYQATRLSGKQRDEYLRKMCPEGTALRTQVMQLLQHSEDASQLLGYIQQKITDDFNYCGHNIDNYRIEDQLGEGGMGVVYSASRADGLYQQHVAIKIIRPGYFNDLHQVEKERQILAHLSHPNIARIFNAGFTGRGEPYLVMEKIDGLPIDEYCKKNQLNLQQKLNIFLQVCDAVKYAHQRLVIHCDLKPSNILINERGEAKLLDFGIASLLDENDEIRHNMLTPAHCAPEQLRNQKINTATDIYQLGLLLHLILSGQPVFKLHKMSFQDKARVILDATPEIRLENVSFKGYLKDDLKAIMQHALLKKPADRYQSVDAFAQDIMQAMRNYPISNLPDHASRRVRKYLLRNRWRTGLAATVILLILAISAFFTYNLNEQKYYASRQADKAESIKSFLLDIIDISDPYSDFGPDVSVKEMLVTAYDKIQNQFDDRPELKAELFSELGLIFANYKETEKATEILTSAIALNQQLYGQNCYQNVDLFAALSMVYNQHKDSVAYQYGKKAIALAIDHHGHNSLKLAQIISNFSTNYYARTEERDTLCLKALEIAENAPGDNRMLIAEILQNCSSWRKSLPGTGIENKERALKLAREVKGDNHPLVGEILNDLSLSYGKVDLQKSYELNQEAYEVSVINLGANHPNTLTIMNNLAVTCRELDRYEDAIYYHRMVVDSLNKHHPDRITSIAFATFGIGMSYRHLGDLEPALQHLYKTKNLFLKIPGNQYLSHLCIIDMKIIEIYLETDNFDPAKELLKSFDRRIFAENAPLDLYKNRVAKLWARYCTETNQPLPDKFQRYL